MNINDIKTVAMIGAGDMGHGIAEVALLAGYKVNLYDIKDEYVELGKKRIFDSLDLLTGKGKNMDALGAQVHATINGVVRKRWLSGGGGFGGMPTRFAHFGLGTAKVAKNVKVM